MIRNQVSGLFMVGFVGTMGSGQLPPTPNLIPASAERLWPGLSAPKSGAWPICVSIPFDYVWSFPQFSW